jgi:hypothetical protein
MTGADTGIVIAKEDQGKILNKHMGQKTRILVKADNMK